MQQIGAIFLTALIFSACGFYTYIYFFSIGYGLSIAAISGQGFIAIAAVIFGKWTPHGGYFACLLFGFAQALTVVLGGGNFVVPSEILAMLPYLMTILVLVLFVGRASAPKANGVPYNKGSRV